MDDKDFLSYFWNLSENTSSKEKILEFSDKIVNSVIAKQKFDSKQQNHVGNKEKFSNFLNVYINPCEDLLYLFKRLVGGILSTGLDMRKGFTLAFQMLLDKLNDVNYSALIDVIEKESIFGKSEKIHYKNCVLTGKILLYKSILSVKSIGIEDILRIFKVLIDLLSDNFKIVEDSVLKIIDEFFIKVFSYHYIEIQDTSNQKHLAKFIDKFLNLLVKIKRSNYENISNLYEYSILLIFDKFAERKNSLKKTSFLYQFSSCFENFVGKTFENSFFLNNNLENFFKLLLKSKKEFDFSFAFKLLQDNLREKMNYQNAYNIWNYLIDSESNEILKESSVKNFQFLLFKYSLFLIKDFFNLKYISQIYDDSFLFSVMNFTPDKKITYIKQIIENLITKLEKTEETHDHKVSTYCLKILNIFGSDRNINLSPNTFKSYFISMFNLLEKSQKTAYVENLFSLKEKDTDEDEEVVVNDNKLSNENVIFRVSALKQLILNKSVVIEEELKDRIVEHFFVEYFTNTNKNLIEIIEERLLLIILSKARNNIKEEKESLNMNKLIHFNQVLVALVKANRINNIDLNDYKIYKKYLKMFSDLSKTVKLKENKRLFVILSLSFIIMIIYLKNVSDFEEILADLYESAKNFVKNETDSQWEQIFMDLVLAILSKGKVVLNEYVISCIKKVSKQLGISSVEVILDFLKEDLTESKKDILMNEVEEDETEETKNLNVSDKSQEDEDEMEQDV